MSIKTEVWDIRETISQLAYLTHNYLRYYGKFPSQVAERLVKRYTNEKETVLDNYAGSGTTLVEAKLSRRNSVGVDILPLSELACRVKTTKLDMGDLVARWRKLRSVLRRDFGLLRSEKRNQSSLSDFALDYVEVDEERIEISIPDFPGMDKWFPEKQIEELGLLRERVFDLPDDEFGEFFRLAFAAIIRRTSRAYDGEIRPHVNKTKNPRKVLEAYEAKTDDMISRMSEFNKVAYDDVSARAIAADNRDLQELGIGTVDLVISHPPYLNSFDYTPSFKLVLYWMGYDYDTLRRKETRAWPATNSKVLDRYFQDAKAAMAESYEVLKDDGHCCVVIGDCTIHKKVYPVQQRFVEIAEEIGFSHSRYISRKTHYGTGKYAYRDRAQKSDGILIFQK